MSNMDINFWTFAKDNDSTARPSTAGYTVTGTLLEPFELKDVTVKIGGLDTVPTFNYAYIADLGRYYFVDNWSYSGGFWYAYLSVDVLASFKPLILETSQFVLRSAKEFEGTIVDDIYPLKTRPFTTTVEATNNPYSATLTNGVFVCGINSNDTANGIGCVNYYAFTITEFRAFCNWLFGGGLITSLGVAASEISAELLKALYNPLQFVASCYWYPFSGLVGRIVYTLPFGYWQADGITCKLLTDPTTSHSLTFSQIPHHPQSNRGYFLRSEPYTTVSLLWEVIGKIDIPAQLLYDASGLTVVLKSDFATGKLQATFYGIDANGTYLSGQNFVITGNSGVAIQLSQIAQDYSINSVKDLAVSGVKGIIKGLAGGWLGQANGIGSFIESSSPSYTTINSNGSFLAYRNNPVINITFHELSEEDRERLGKPLCAPRKLSTLVKDNDHNGYVICSNVELDITATHDEISEIKEKLEGGCYLQ